jgi:5-methylcytosine-specific restriction endonuclease McrA
MKETRFSCQYCGEHFETKSDLQDHEANCLEAGEGNQQQKAMTGRAGGQGWDNGTNL